jgi:hypothetical protein
VSSAKSWKTVAANAIGSSLAGFVVAVSLNGSGMSPTTSTRPASDYSTPIDYTTPLVLPTDGKQRVGGPTAVNRVFGSVDTYPNDYGYADYTDYRYAPKPKSGRITDRRSPGYVDTSGDNLGYVDTHGRR